MYAHALTYPSLHTRSPRHVRIRRRRVFLRRNTQHVRASGRRRAPSVSWRAEIMRMTAALANVAAWTALLFLF